MHQKHPPANVATAAPGGGGGSFAIWPNAPAAANDSRANPSLARESCTDRAERIIRGPRENSPATVAAGVPLVGGGLANLRPRDAAAALDYSPRRKSTAGSKRESNAR